MRPVRAVPGALLWIRAAVAGLLGALLCVTVIRLPGGSPAPAGCATHVRHLGVVEKKTKQKGKRLRTALS